MIAYLIMLQAGANTMAVPEQVTAASVVATPTAAARALAVAGVTLPATPASFTFQCLVLRGNMPGNCIDAKEGVVLDQKAFWPRIENLQQATETDPLLRAARLKTAFYRLRPAPFGKKIRSVLIRETVSLADAPPSERAGVRVDQKELAITEFDISDFYPPAALRAGAQTRVTATCRVLADYSLLCRNAQVDLVPVAGDQPSSRAPTLDPMFMRATVRALSTAKVRPTLTSGGSSIGREAEFTVNWTLPND